MPGPRPGAPAISATLNHEITQISYLYEPTTFGGTDVVAYEYYVPGQNQYYLQLTGQEPNLIANLGAQVPAISSMNAAFSGTTTGAMVPISLAQANGLTQVYPNAQPGKTPPAQGSGNCFASS